MAFQKQFSVQSSMDLQPKGDYAYSAYEFLAFKGDDQKLRGFLGVQRYSEKDMDDYGAYAIEIGDHESILAIKNSGRMTAQTDALNETLLKGLEIDESRLQKFNINDNDAFEKTVIGMLDSMASSNQELSAPEEEKPKPKGFQAPSISF